MLKPIWLRNKGKKTSRTHFKQKGEDHYGNKYSEDLIREIKHFFKEDITQKEVNILTGVPTKYLYSIRSGFRWGHVEV